MIENCIKEKEDYKKTMLAILVMLIAGGLFFRFNRSTTVLYEIGNEKENYYGSL